MPAPVLLTPIIGSISSSIVDTIKGIFGQKAWSWRLIVPVNRQRIGGIYALFSVLNRVDRIEYWHNLFTTTKGIGIDAGPNYIMQAANEVTALTRAAGIPDSRNIEIYNEGFKYPVSEDGQWSPPPSLVSQQITPTIPIAQAATQVLAGIGGSGTFNIILLVLMVGVLVFLLFTKRR